MPSTKSSPAKAKPGAGAPYSFVKSDEILLDTSSAPWMAIALEELGRKVHELAANDAFVDSLRDALTWDARMTALQRQIEQLGSESVLLGQPKSAVERLRLPLKNRTLPNLAMKSVGDMEATRLRERNPEIVKYFEGVRSDPVYDPKARSFDIAATSGTESGYGRITAWCAAFVNWCLVQAGAPHLGYATAKSWLGFGTPVASPTYGCVTIVRPSSSTGSTTGHVAFFVERSGSQVVLLGGNQGDWVSKAKFAESSVLGYRWPTRFDHYRVGAGGVDIA